MNDWLRFKVRTAWNLSVILALWATGIAHLAYAELPDGLTSSSELWAYKQRLEEALEKRPVDLQASSAEGPDHESPRTPSAKEFSNVSNEELETRLGAVTKALEKLKGDEGGRKDFPLLSFRQRSAEGIESKNPLGTTLPAPNPLSLMRRDRDPSALPSIPSDSAEMTPEKYFKQIVSSPQMESHLTEFGGQGFETMNAVLEKRYQRYKAIRNFIEKGDGKDAAAVSKDLSPVERREVLDYLNRTASADPGRAESLRRSVEDGFIQNRDRDLAAVFEKKTKEVFPDEKEKSFRKFGPLADWQRLTPNEFTKMMTAKKLRPTETYDYLKEEQRLAIRSLGTDPSSLAPAIKAAEDLVRKENEDRIRDQAETEGLSRRAKALGVSLSSDETRKLRETPEFRAQMDRALHTVNEGLVVWDKARAPELVSSLGKQLEAMKKEKERSRDENSLIPIVEEVKRLAEATIAPPESKPFRDTGAIDLATVSYHDQLASRWQLLKRKLPPGPLKERASHFADEAQEKAKKMRAVEFGAVAGMTAAEIEAAAKEVGITLKPKKEEDPKISDGELRKKASDLAQGLALTGDEGVNDLLLRKQFDGSIPWLVQEQLELRIRERRKAVAQMANEDGGSAARRMALEEVHRLESAALRAKQRNATPQVYEALYGTELREKHELELKRLFGDVPAGERVRTKISEKDFGFGEAVSGRGAEAIQNRVDQWADWATKQDWLKGNQKVRAELAAAAAVSSDSTLTEEQRKGAKELLQSFASGMEEAKERLKQSTIEGILANQKREGSEAYPREDLQRALEVLVKRDDKGNYLSAVAIKKGSGVEERATLQWLNTASSILRQPMVIPHYNHDNRVPSPSSVGTLGWISALGKADPNQPRKGDQGFFTESESSFSTDSTADFAYLLPGPGAFKSGAQVLAATGKAAAAKAAAPSLARAAANTGKLMAVSAPIGGAFYGLKSGAKYLDYLGGQGEAPDFTPAGVGNWFVGLGQSSAQMAAMAPLLRLFPGALVPFSKDGLAAAAEHAKRGENFQSLEALAELSSPFLMAAAGKAVANIGKQKEVKPFGEMLKELGIDKVPPGELSAALKGIAEAPAGTHTPETIARAQWLGEMLAAHEKTLTPTERVDLHNHLLGVLGIEYYVNKVAGGDPVALVEKIGRAFSEDPTLSRESPNVKRAADEALKELNKPELTPEARRRLAQDVLPDLLTATNKTPYNEPYSVIDHLIKKKDGIGYREFVKDTVRQLSKEGIEISEQSISLKKLTSGKFEPEMLDAIASELKAEGIARPARVQFLAMLPTKYLANEPLSPEMVNSIRQALARKDIKGIDFASPEKHSFGKVGMKNFETIVEIAAEVGAKKGERVVVRPHVGEGYPETASRPAAAEGPVEQPFDRKTPVRGKNGEVSHAEVAEGNIETLLNTLERMKLSSDGHALVRLGHMTYATPKQLARLAELPVLVEVNLTSNVVTGAMAVRPGSSTIHDGHLLNLLNSGVDFVLGTDGESVMHTTLGRERLVAKQVVDRFVAGKINMRLGNGKEVSYQELLVQEHLATDAKVLPLDYVPVKNRFDIARVDRVAAKYLKQVDQAPVDIPISARAVPAKAYVIRLKAEYEKFMKRIGQVEEPAALAVGANEVSGPPKKLILPGDPPAGPPKKLIYLPWE